LTAAVRNGARSQALNESFSGNVLFSSRTTLDKFGAFNAMIPTVSFDFPSHVVMVDTEFAIISAHLVMESHKGEITVLLERLAKGDQSAEEALMPRVYIQLHQLALSRLRTERPGHTLQATALVHEVYLRMCRSEELKIHDRAHFFRVAARLMRRILVDYARQHGAQKRNDGKPLNYIDSVIAISPTQSDDAIQVDELLDRLAKLSPRQAQVVEMRFYGGLTEDEIALALGKHIRTIRRDWLMARAWLHEQLKRN
jgi:RNA polymerase sigma factor (TIGR02999 family)